MSWNITKYTQHCDKCNTEYQVTKHEHPMRDRGVFNCEECGHEMQKWNGAVDYTFTKAKISE